MLEKTGRNSSRQSTIKKGTHNNSEGEKKPQKCLLNLSQEVTKCL